MAMNTAPTTSGVPASYQPVHNRHAMMFAVTTAAFYVVGALVALLNAFISGSFQLPHGISVWLLPFAPAILGILVLIQHSLVSGGPPTT